MTHDRLVLTPEQRDIVQHQQGALLVQAPVGSGKTLVLAVRAVEALERGVLPGEMLALTFTNRAARQMRDRLTGLVGVAPPDLTVTTFHGLCVRILRRDGKELAIEPDFAIWDEVDRREAIRLAAEQCEWLRDMPLLSSNPRDWNDEQRRAVEKRLAALIKSITDHKADGKLPQNLPASDDLPMRVFREYQHLLDTSRALDFDDLVVQTWTLLGRFPAVHEAWSARCRWVEVDEFQDTSNLEYKVLRQLTAHQHSLCVFGDLEQSIYSWRGVQSQALYSRFQGDHPQAAQRSLSQNFRSTPAILAAARGVLRPAAGAGTAAPVAGVRLVACPTDEDERAYIARRVVDVHRAGAAWSSIAVLARDNDAVMRLAEMLANRDVPVATAAVAAFFRQPLVKDVAAYLRLIDDPRDEIALRRIADKPARGLSPDLLSQIAKHGRACHLLLTDLLDEETLAEGDPCSLALATAARDYVVLDLEATGLDREVDEPVEIALVRVDGTTGRCDERRWLVRPSRPVGASVATHGYTDADLAEHGCPPAAVYAEVRDSIGRRPIVGHNIEQYDEPMLARAFERAGLPALRNRTIDTLWLARHVLALDRHNLDRVRQACGVDVTPDHHALADAQCTADCFRVLVDRLAETTTARRALVARHGAAFRPLATLHGGWLARADTLSIGDLLDQVVEESGYLRFVLAQPGDHQRLIDDLALLRALVIARFDALPPVAARRALLDYLSTARTADGAAYDEDRVLVLTLHAAKGLEFDAVFIAGAHDAVFPSWRSNHGAARDEDRRLLYVGMTRAKHSLEITYPEQETLPRGGVRARGASPFLAHLARG